MLSNCCNVLRPINVRPHPESTMPYPGDEIRDACKLSVADKHSVIPTKAGARVSLEVAST